MSFSYQFGANPPIDYPRLLIADTVDVGHIFEDSEITAAGAITAIGCIVPSGAGQATITGTPSYRYIAATLLRALASNKARLANALKVLDIQVNTASASRELKELAKQYEEAEDNSGAFAIVEWTVNDFAARERLWKQFVRLEA